MTDTSTDALDKLVAELNGQKYYALEGSSMARIEALCQTAGDIICELAIERDALLERIEKLTAERDQLKENRADRGYLEGVYLE